jgi:hypothetical protein
LLCLFAAKAAFSKSIGSTVIPHALQDGKWILRGFVGSKLGGMGLANEHIRQTQVAFGVGVGDGAITLWGLSWRLTLAETARGDCVLTAGIGERFDTIGSNVTLAEDFRNPA